MNEDALNDPVLQSLEARLAASVPQLSGAEQQELFYACAFAAGQRTAVRSTRRWQAVTAALGLAVIGLVVPQLSEPTKIARTGPVQNESQAEIVKMDNAATHVGDSTSSLPDFWPTVERPSSVRLDAWQRTPLMSQSDSTKLAQHNSSATRTDGLTVGGLNLGALD